MSHAAFVAHALRGTLFWRFDLRSGPDRHSISLSLPAASGPDSPDARAFLDLLDAVCSVLARVQPGFEAGLGEYGPFRWIWFGIGVVSLLTGGGILTAAVLDGVSSDRLIPASLGLGALMLLGLVLLWDYNPWRKPPKLPVETLAKLVRNRIGNSP